MKAGRFLIRAALAVGLLAGVAVIALYWASHSESALRWALELAARELPGKLEIDGVHGSVIEPVSIDRLRYVEDGLTVEAHRIALSWSPAALGLAKRVSVQELRIGDLSVTVASSGKPSQPVSLPKDLGLPIPVSLDRVQVDRLSIQAGTSPVVLSGIILAYAGDARGHRFRVDSLHSPWGEATADLGLTAGAPHAIAGSAGFKGKFAEGWPASVQLKLGGNLQRIDAAALVEVRGIPIDGTLRVAPFDSIWLQQVTAHTAALDLKRFADAAPRASLEVNFDGRGVDATRIEGEVAARNTLAGTIDQDRLPVRSLTGHLKLGTDAIQLTDAALDLGPGGSARGTATVDAKGVAATLQTDNLDLRGLHAALRPTKLAGELSATVDGSGQSYRGTLSQKGIRVAFSTRQQQDTLTVDSLLAQAGPAQLSANGSIALSAPNRFSAHAELRRFDPAAFGDFPAADINGTFAGSGHVRPAWQVALTYQLGDSRFRGQPLSGAGSLTLSESLAKDVNARLALGRNRVELRGAFGSAGDVMNVDLEAQALQIVGPGWAGSARARGRVGGTWSQPNGDLAFSARALKVPGGYALAALDGTAKVERPEDPRFDVAVRAQGLKLGTRELQDVAIAAAGTFSHHDIRVNATGMEMQVEGRAEGAWSYPQHAWSGRVLDLANKGRYPMRLTAPLPLSIAPGRVALGPSELALLGGKINIGETRYAPGEVTSSGSLTGISAAQLLEWLRYSQAAQVSLVFGGRWSVTAREHADGRVELFREAGDVEVVSDEERFPLELRALAARIDIVQDRVNAQASAESPKAGRMTASVTTKVEQRGGKWGLAAATPIAGSARAEVGSLRSLVALFTRSVRVDGALALDARIGGTVAAPELDGRADVQKMSIEQIENGVLLHDGVLHAKFSGRRLDVASFVITGGQGQLSASGYATADNGHLNVAIDWTAKDFAAVQKPGLLLAVDGKGNVALKDDRLAIAGTVVVQRGRVELAGSVPTLGDDVVVVGAKQRSPAAMQASRPAVDLDLDLGRDFKVQGRGLDARVEGRLKLQTPGGEAPLTANGDISVARGTYDAYGRKLDIEKGKLHFAGEVDNPVVEIRAMRKNQQVEAGVEITGPVRTPQVRLVSNPDVPDSEKISWLVLGHKADSKNHSDTQALQSSAALLLAGAGTSEQQGNIARSLGVDEINLTPTESTTGGTTAVVGVSKRISERIYVTFEQSLDEASKIVRVNYQLSRRWTLRTEAGTSDAVGLYYSLSFD